MERGLHRVTGPQPGQATTRTSLPEGAALMEFKIPQKGFATLIYEAGSSGGVRRWRAIDNVALHTRDGMLISTRGTGDDLMTTQVDGAAALIASGGTGQITRFHRRLDGEDQFEMRAWVCDIRPDGYEEIPVSQTEVSTTLRMAEVCHGTHDGFTNLYWVEDGQIRRQLQHFSAQIGPVQLLFLK